MSDKVGYLQTIGKYVGSAMSGSPRPTWVFIPASQPSPAVVVPVAEAVSEVVVPVSEPEPEVVVPLPEPEPEVVPVPEVVAEVSAEPEPEVVEQESQLSSE